MEYLHSYNPIWEYKKSSSGLHSHGFKCTNETYKICLENLVEVETMYKAITNRSVTVSEMVRLSETMLKLVNIMQNMTSADREGNWVGHLKTIQDMLPLLCQTESITYQQYFSFDLEMMQIKSTSLRLLLENSTIQNPFRTK